MTTGLNRLSSYTHFYDIFHFLQFLRSEILRIPGNDKRNLENFYFFSFLKNFARYCYDSVKSTKIIKKKIFKSLPTMVGQWKKISFLEWLKCLFHHSENTSFSKKINIRLKSPGSQMLILFRKIPSCKWTLEGGDNIINLVLIYDQQWCYEKVFTIAEDYSKVLTDVQSRPDFPA